MIEIIKVVSKCGIEYALVGALIYIVWYLVKHTVIRLSKVIDRLAETIDGLMKNIERHEEESARRSRYIKEEHSQMISALGRINGYKKE